MASCLLDGHLPLPFFSFFHAGQDTKKECGEGNGHNHLLLLWKDGANFCSRFLPFLPFFFYPPIFLFINERVWREGLSVQVTDPIFRGGRALTASFSVPPLFFPLSLLPSGTKHIKRKHSDGMRAASLGQVTKRTGDVPFSFLPPSPLSNWSRGRAISSARQVLSVGTYLKCSIPVFFFLFLFFFPPEPFQATKREKKRIVPDERRSRGLSWLPLLFFPPLFPHSKTYTLKLI